MSDRIHMQDKTITTEKIVSAYEKLPPFEQVLVQLCSVIYEPTNRLFISKCLRRAEIGVDREKICTSKELDLYLGKLIGLELLDDQLRCNEGLVEIATRHAISAGHYEAMVGVVQDQKPLPDYHDDKKQYCSRLMRDFRIGIYSHNEDLRNKCYRGILSHCPAHYVEPDPFIQVCSNPFDAGWFSTLSLGVQEYTLSIIFDRAIWKLEPDRDALSYVLNQNSLDVLPEPERHRLYHFLITRLIMGGRLRQAREMISKIEESGYTNGLLGWIYFLEGKNDRAIEIFEADLKELRRRTGKKTRCFTGIPGLFYVLALLKRQDSSLLNKVDKFISAAQSDKYQNPYMVSAYSSLKTIVRAQDFDDESAILVKKENNDTSETASLFFSAFASYWLQNQLDRKSIVALTEIFIKANKIGLKWLAMECAELFCLAGHGRSVYRKYADRIRKETGMQSIVPVIRIEESWQKGLRALIHITASDRQSSAKSGNKRLVWLISYYDGAISLLPKEQKLTSKGTWSKGRPVALSRLRNGNKLDYITSQDHIIRATIEKESNYYYGTRYFFKWEKTLPALVGHPLLFLSESPSIPVELVKGEPEVVVSQSGSVLNIRFSEPVSDEPVMIIQEMPTRLKVIELTKEHRRIGRILGDKGLEVPVASKEQVLSAIGGISSLVTVHSAIGGKSKDIDQIDADPGIYVHLLPSGSGFRLEMFVRPFGTGGPYLRPGIGAENVIAEIDGIRMQTRRNLMLEGKNALMVEAGCPTLTMCEQTGRQWFLEDPEDCLEVLLDLKALQDMNEVKVEWPEGEKLRVAHQASFEQLNLKIRGTTNWFEAKGQLKLNDDLVIDMRKLLDLVRKSKSRFIPLGEGQFVALTQEFRNRLEEIDSFSRKRGRAIHFHASGSLALKDFTDNLVHLDTDKTWEAHLKRISDGQQLQPVVPSTLKARLRDYQVEGYQWLTRLAYWGVGACLADDMGLGKTIQALAVILARAPHGPTLVVAPKSVCLNWVAEAERFAPTLNFTIFAGKNRKDQIKGLKPLDVIVASYGMLQQEKELLASLQWSTIILDEAQAIKNITSKRSQAAMSLQGEFKVITTGTPIENHLGELFTLFDFINPGLLGSRKAFNERFAVPISRNNANVKRTCKKLIQPFILRRIKSQVLEELPPRTDIILQVEMSPEEAAFYEALRQAAIKKLEFAEMPAGQRHLRILAEIMKLRRACCNTRLIVPESGLPSAKLDLFGEVVSELLENRHKALVFSQFVGHLSIIREFLDIKGIDYRYLDGSTPAARRSEEVNAFQAGQGDLFLISLKAGGLGLNLTAADYVIHMDPWWNPAVEDQASDRAHRIGQQRPVTVYRLVTRDTIEEKIVKLHQEKRDLASSLLEGSDMSGKMSAGELLKLIKEQ
ncbi:MAG: DEAD/DEAH box helicase [Thermodesulfobacteriota bacterium]|nr:DEAD/DEAH box helicase [Thermodesulfobacteriota bacterium]